MRLTFSFICILTFTFAYSQPPALNKLWVGNANNYVKIDTDAIRVECVYEFQGKKRLNTQAYRYFLGGDTLRVIEPPPNSDIHHDFIISTLSNDELKLVPLNFDGQILACTEIPGKVLTFRDQNKVYTDTISFQKILFSSTTCYGTCPAMSFEIDNKKQMKFSGDKFAVKKGFYTAILPDFLYSQLLKTIAVSELDKLENYGNFNIDAPTYMLEVHYNNKVKFIKSSFLPFVTEELLNYLLDLPKKVELIQAEPFKILFSQ